MVEEDKLVGSFRSRFYDISVGNVCVLEGGGGQNGERFEE